MEDDMMHDGWMNWGEGGWSGMWFGPLFITGVLFLAVALLFVVRRGRSGGSTGTTNSTRTPRQILDERFARGEINREEFEQRRKAVET
jgi:putative membrane protein